MAQQATTAAVVEATGIAESELFHDRQVNHSLEHGPWAFVFIDNIGFIGKDREEVTRVMGRISHEFCSRGLLTHEFCLASWCSTSWGSSWMVNGCALTQVWVSTRNWVWLCIGSLGNDGSGDKLERVMEHVLYTYLVRLLLVRHACAIGLACHFRQYFRWIPRRETRGRSQNFSVYASQGLHNESDQSIVSSHPWLFHAQNLLLSVPPLCVNMKESPHVG